MGQFPKHSTQSTLTAIRRLAAISLLGLVLAMSLAGGKTRKAGLDTAKRTVASQPYPRHPRLKDEDDILERYRDYLTFVLSIARSTNATQAHNLSEQFRKLEKESPTNAARFLKGLKFEMDQKVEIMGLVPARVSSSNSQLRPWVGKFMGTWVREVDEARFRAYTDKLIAKRRKSD